MLIFLRNNRYYIFIALIIVFFRLFLLFTVSTSSNFFTTQNNFLGGHSEYYRSPTVWAFSNFDGERYINLARSGYANSDYYYFPLFFLIVRYFSSVWGDGIYAFLYSGLFVSFVCFVFLIIGLWKLINIEFTEKIALMSILLLIFFPTSFYLFSVYTESLFFALCVWSFFYARRGNWFLASVLALFASATRVVGVVMMISLFVEYLNQNKWKLKFTNSDILNYFKILLSSLGLIIYMSFLKLRTGNFLAFYTNLENIFGSQRSSHLILLPQVFYRYIFKIIPNVNYSFFPNFYSTYLEFLLSVLFLLIIFLSYKRLRFSYFLFSLGVYLIPTLSGSFSSMPRYVLPCFVVYILTSIYFSKNKNRMIVFCVILLCMIMLTYITFGLFSNGYWIA